MGEGKDKREKTFQDLATAAGIKSESVTKLSDADCDTTAAIKLLQDSDLESLGLTLGQKRLLQKWRDTLNTPRGGAGKKSQSGADGALGLPPPITDRDRTDGATGTAPEAPETATTATLNRDRDLADLMKSFQLGAGDELWEDATARDATDPRPQGTLKPALLIPDFVTRATQGTGDDSLEREVCKQGGAQLVLRQARVKPLAEQVSLAQYLSANARIMARLILEGRLRTEDILDYLEYTADIGDYAQVCDIPSVMLYDQEYRKKQARKGAKWGTADIHLSTFYLQKKRGRHDASPTSVTPTPRAVKPPRQVDRRGVEICRSYNAWGCNRDQCRYSHVCSLCKDPHPKSSHLAGNSTLTPGERPPSGATQYHH